MSNKRDNVSINYLSRDFQTIKEDLLRYTKRYYPDTFKDFSTAGFGALMLDAVAYTSDILSFYLDYQANESFLSTATEYENVLKHGQTVGYKHQGARTTHGIVTLYVLIPANSDASGPDMSYAPLMKAGSTTIFNGCRAIHPYGRRKLRLIGKRNSRRQDGFINWRANFLRCKSYRASCLG